MPVSRWKAFQNENQRRIAEEQRDSLNMAILARQLRGGPSSPGEAQYMASQQEQMPPSSPGPASVPQGSNASSPSPGAGAGGSPVDPVAPIAAAPIAAAPQAQGGPSVYDSLGAESLGAIMNMGGLEDQMETAKGLRDKTVEGMTINNGRTYIAGNPLAHAVNAYGQYKGRKDVKRIGEEQAAERMKLLEVLRNVGKPVEDDIGVGRVA